MTGLDGAPPRGEGPLGPARALGGTVLALLRVRIELAAVELRENAERSKLLVMLGFAASVFLVSSLVLAGIFVMVLFWDTYRMPAIGGMTLVYAIVGGWAFLRFREVLRDAAPPFSATLDEFRKDLDQLRGHDE